MFTNDFVEFIDFVVEVGALSFVLVKLPVLFFDVI